MLGDCIKERPIIQLENSQSKDDKNGKIEFKPVHQTFIELVEATANNVDHPWCGAEEVGDKLYPCHSRWSEIRGSTRHSGYAYMEKISYIAIATCR